MEIIQKQTCKTVKNKFYKRLKPSYLKRAFLLIRQLFKQKIDFSQILAYNFCLDMLYSLIMSFFPVLQPGK